jgi:hypothetical protein
MGANAVSELLTPAQAVRYELRFTDLSTGRCACAFPCDRTGVVDIDALTDRRRTDYFYARSMVGKEVSRPVVSRVGKDSPDDPGPIPLHDQRELAS